MIKSYKSIRKLQRTRSAYNTLKKKLCKKCNKGLQDNIVNNEEVKNFDFCVECSPLTERVISLQAELDEETNKNIVNGFNEKKRGV